MTAAITVYDSRGCSHMMRLALAAMALVFCPATMDPMPVSASWKCSIPFEVLRLAGRERNQRHRRGHRNPL
eukprot:5126101-Pleurochrysis_carterae.AAC.1